MNKQQRLITPSTARFTVGDVLEVVKVQATAILVEVVLHQRNELPGTESSNRLPDLGVSVAESVATKEKLS